jgi:RAD54-like protein 2
MVQSWSQTGGTLIMGYEMFRLLVTKKNSSSTKTNKSIVTQPVTPVVVDLEEEEKNFETMEGNKYLENRCCILIFEFLDIRNALLNPDLVICDEGHRIKNHQASAAVALKSIRTQFVFFDHRISSLIFFY